MSLGEKPILPLSHTLLENEIVDGQKIRIIKPIGWTVLSTFLIY